MPLNLIYSIIQNYQGRMGGIGDFGGPSPGSFKGRKKKGNGNGKKRGRQTKKRKEKERRGPDNSKVNQ